MKIDSLPIYYLNCRVSYNLRRDEPEGVWKGLYRATNLARVNKSELITSGKSLCTNLNGQVDISKELTFVIYHVPINESESELKALDVPRIDFKNINHSKLLRHTINSILHNNSNCQIILLTSLRFAEHFSDLPVSILAPNVDNTKPMYCRALCYNSLIQNYNLKGTIVFIDSDCLILKNFHGVAQKMNFCVGLTYRFSPALMPINEGVIIVNGNDSRCRDFFAHYMGTYQMLKDDRILSNIFRVDLQKWRGGQLSINAISPGVRHVNFLDSNDYIRLLPAEDYNHTAKYMNLNTLNKESIQKEDLADILRDKWILHLKGKTKRNLDQIVENIRAIQASD